MSNIILYKGQFQYDVANVFVDQWAQAFRDLGHSTTIVDFLSNRWQSQLAEVLNKTTDVAIAFNGIASDLRVGKVSPYDQFNIRYIPVLLNHPSNTRERLTHCSNQLPVCMDRDHLRFVETYTPDLAHAPVFLPHAACTTATGPETEDRPLDVIFCGSGVDPLQLRELWRQIPAPLHDIVHAIADTCLADETRAVPLDKIAASLLAQADIEPDSAHYQTVLTLLAVIDTYVRAATRLQCLQLLDRQRVPVHIFGNGWEFARFRRHTLHPAQPFTSMLETMGQARIALDISPDIRFGSNERVLSAMGQGALAITSTNPFYDEHFPNGEISTFTWAGKDGLAAQLNALLTDSEQCDYQARAGQTAALARHTWKPRAESLLRSLADVSCQAVSAA